MQTSAPEALVKETNIVKFSWKLCSQRLKKEKKMLFSIQNFIFLIFLTSAAETLVNITHIFTVLHE
jgi:hypothetical protein